MPGEYPTGHRFSLETRGTAECTHFHFPQFGWQLSERVFCASTVASFLTMVVLWEAEAGEVDLMVLGVEEKIEGRQAVEGI
jgi:hypothetical protein